MFKKSIIAAIILTNGFLLCYLVLKQQFTANSKIEKIPVARPWSSQISENETSDIDWSVDSLKMMLENYRRENQALSAAIKNLTNEYNPKIEDLSRQFEEIDKKLMILGITNNENVFVQKNKQATENLIFLNTNWELNKEPSHVKIDQDTRSLLQQFLPRK